MVHRSGRELYQDGQGMWGCERFWGDGDVGSSLGDGMGDIDELRVVGDGGDWV